MAKLPPEQEQLHVRKLHGDLVERFEFELSSLLRSAEELTDADYQERRVALREKFIDQFATLSATIVNPEEPNYRAIFLDLLDDLYSKQMAGHAVAETLQTKVKLANERKGLPQDQWDSFDEKTFSRYIEMLGLLYLLDKLLDIFDLPKYRDMIVASELERLQSKGRPKTGSR